MAKSKVMRAKAKGLAALKTKGRSVSAPQPRDYYDYAGLYCGLAAPYQYTEELSGEGEHGSLELYVGLQPKSALESILASLIIGVSNATNDCLYLAAKIPPQELQHRDVNLRHALKGAAVVTKLVDALERVRGNRPGNVSVGKVNVESGGQAIVGTVQSSSLGQEPDATIGSDHTKAPGRK
jgi:hypothetical protein